MANRQNSTYVMGSRREEYERLRRQGKMLERATSSLLDRIGIAAGASCLDVSCGVGEVMRIMAERTGPTGRVVGLDIDGTLGREAIYELFDHGYTQCSFIEGDLYALDLTGSELFDLVYARFVVERMDDPISGLRQMYRWVSPGGHLLIQDHYYPSLELDSPSEAVTELKTTLSAVWEREGRDPRVGILLPRYFIQSGIGAPDGTDVSGDLLPMRDSAEMSAVLYRSLLPLALKSGITSEQRSQWFFEQIVQAQMDDDSYLLSPLIVSAWKQKPHS